MAAKIKENIMRIFLILLILMGCESYNDMGEFTTSILSIEPVIGGLDFHIQAIKIDDNAQEAVLVSLQYIYKNSDSLRVLSSYHDLYIGYVEYNDTIRMHLICPRLAHPVTGNIYYEANAN